MSLENLQQGRYHLLKPIGKGAMGEVYLAEDTHAHRPVAIKVIHKGDVHEAGTDTFNEALRLFRREMRAISRLSHSYILPLLDYGEEDVNGTPLPYMVMSWCPDGSLAKWQREHKPPSLSPREVAHFMHQAADALQYAHDQQLIHQDIKPSNFLIRTRQDRLPDLLLADFGVAQSFTATASTLTKIRGTPAYMPLEQWRRQPVPASDQYALAIMAYELLTGRVPFQGNVTELLCAHLSETPQPPSKLNPTVSPALDAVILRALAKNPADRYPSITAFAEAFERAVDGSVDTPPAVRVPPARVANNPPITGRSIGSRTQPLPSQVRAITFMPLLKGTGQRVQDRKGLGRWSFVGLFLVMLSVAILAIGPTLLTRLRDPSPLTPTAQEMYTQYTQAQPSSEDDWLHSWSWFNGGSTYGNCTFQNGAYHATPKRQNTFAMCIASLSTEQFTNLPFRYK
jgi:serine/threonine protein kinase